MDLKHQWIGKIESSEQFLKRNRKVSQFNLELGLIIIITAIVILFVYPGRAVITGSNVGLMIYFVFLMIGVVPMILGLTFLVRRSYFVGMHIFVDEEDINYWLKNGTLRKNIEKALSTVGIDFTKRKRHYPSIYYELPEGLSIGVGGPIDQGRIKGKPISLIMIQITNIKTENMELARKVQNLLDGLDIQDKYFPKEDKEQAASIDTDGGI
jgi:hypothetical protein